MFSCGSDVVEDRNNIFDLAKIVKEFLSTYDYRLNLYGGESFLDIPLIKEYIDELIDGQCISFSIPTNGYFVSDGALLTKIDSLFAGKTNTKEKSKITISTSEFHQSQWSQEIKNVISDPLQLTKYANLHKLLEIQNTFTTQRIIPYGRAKNNLRCVNPIVRCDLFENSEDLEISIDPNGDVGFCEFGHKIGNVRNMTIEEVLDIKRKSINKNKNKNVMFRRLNNVCKKCGKYVCIK